MRLRKKVFALITVAVLLCTTGVTAFANDVPDTSRKGSIQITMCQGETVVPGGSITMYRVGAVVEDDGNYSYSLTDDFVGSDASMEDIQSASLAGELAEYASSNGFFGMTKNIGSDGNVSFSNLEIGLYLLVQNTAADGYYKVDPFLVGIPMLENGEYVYDVDASPKVELEKETETEKPKNPPTSEKSKLPQTGQLNWPVPVLVVLGLGLFAIGWLLRFGKRKGEYEK